MLFFLQVKFCYFFERGFKMCRFSLDEATTRSQSLRLFFFKYFLVRYFRYLGKKEKTRKSGEVRKPSTILEPVLRIRDVYPGLWIPDPASKRSRIRIIILNIFNPKNCFQALGNIIRDTHPGYGSLILIFLPIPDPGSRIPDPDPQH